MLVHSTTRGDWDYEVHYFPIGEEFTVYQLKRHGTRQLTNPIPRDRPLEEYTAQAYESLVDTALAREVSE